MDETGGQHYKTCDTCGVEFDLAAHQLTWADDGDGTGRQACAVCGYTTGEHTHASETWHVDEENGRHYKTCDTCGAEFSRAAHAWDEGVVTLEPTVEAEGSRLYTCSVCGATKREPISKLDTFQISGAVTAFAYASDEQQVMENGFDAYMAKPINANQLRTQISAILKQHIIFM